MKKLILILFLGTSAAFAGDLHMQRGQKMNVIVDDCKSSEYSEVDIVRPNFNGGEFAFKTIRAKCTPKICLYNGSSLFGYVVTLLPEKKKIAEPSTSAELDVVLEKFIKDGICAKAKRKVPSM